METEHMNFKDFIGYLIKHEPSKNYIMIHPDQVVEYHIIPNLSRIGALFAPRDQKELFASSLSFVAGMQPFLPEGCVLKIGNAFLPISNNKNLEDKLKEMAKLEDSQEDEYSAGRVKIYYQPKTSEEFQEIKDFIVATKKEGISVYG